MTFTTSSALVGHLVAALAERRRALKLSQVDVDAKLGWADGLLAKYEAGMRSPTIQALTWWAEALGVTVGIVAQERPATDREAVRAAALVHLCNGRGVRETARMLGVPFANVAYWRRRVQLLHDRKFRETMKRRRLA